MTNVKESVFSVGNRTMDRPVLSVINVRNELFQLILKFVLKYVCCHTNSWLSTKP